jgi:protein-L-isoaspartate(D-aspartate) O-methyltransferase
MDSPRSVVLGVLVAVIAACTGGMNSEEAASGTPSTEGVTARSAVTFESVPPAAAERAEERAVMVENQIERRGVVDQLVLEALRTVPRHRFVPDDLASRAYGDHALPIGYGQTISQPYVVALMTESLSVEPGDTVLEIGTGSGYQAAVLAQMGTVVYSIEIIPGLAEQAAGALDELGYSVELRVGDGYFGWEEAAPFDAIVVTAAPDHVPAPLVEQLATGGIMVIPVGPIGAVQTLWQFTKAENGELEARSLGPVMFVPFTRGDS